jgi:hypothetical protein
VRPVIYYVADCFSYDKRETPTPGPAGNVLEAMSADIRSCCSLWRAALDKRHAADEADRPPGLEGAVPELADEVERRLDEFLAEAAGNVEALGAPLAEEAARKKEQGRQQARLAQKEEDEEEHKEDKDKEVEKEDKDDEVEEEEVDDPHGLDTPARPFTCSEGCRCALQGAGLRSGLCRDASSA